MPRNYAATAPGGRPATNRSVSALGPGNDAEDDILKARLSTLNTEPFTPEHSAAYAAFAGITDRKTALHLHRHRVTWDDVNDYATLGTLGPTDYHHMIALRAAGVSPTTYEAWNAMAVRRNVSVAISELVLYTQNEITIEQAEPFYAPDSAGTRTIRPAVAVTQLIHAGIDPDTAGRFAAVGIQNTANMSYLHKMGATPDTVTAYRNAPGTTSPVFAFERDFMRYVMDVARAVDRPALARVAVACNATPQVAAAWGQIDEPLNRIDLFLKARITPEEYHADPTVREVDDATLAMLAALNGHSTIRAATAAA